MSRCLICESPLKPQNVLRADVKLSELSLCISCGTANQPNIKNCVSCGSSLPEPSHRAFENRPMKHFDATLVKKCTKCGRNNNANARFCDWCRSKIYDLPCSEAFVPIQCTQCCSNNQPHAQYCSNCGTTLQTTFGSTTVSNGCDIASYLQPVVKKLDASTQTVGLFYPSKPKFKHQEILESIVKSRLDDEGDRNWTDRRSILSSALSPGRGYWRKQVEHICAHLKTHVSNDTNFRSLIAQPRMGKLLQATVNEDGYELSVTLNFALRASDNIIDTKKLKNKPMTSDFDNESFEDQDLRKFKATSNGFTKNSRKTSNKKLPSKDDESDKNLLKEVGKLGRGRADKVLELIDEGADPLNCTDKDGLSILHVAAINKHAEVIPVLVQAGVHVDVTEPLMHNTPLHEAVKDGSSSMAHVVEVLLGCGANPSIKNKLGESPYDIALKHGCDDLATKLSSFLGQSSISKLSKPKKTQMYY